MPLPHPVSASQGTCWRLFLVCVCALLISACGGGGEDGGDSGTNTIPGGGGNVTIPTFNNTLMGFVTNPLGEPVVGATVGGDAMSGSDGVALGDPVPTDAGWYEVRAPGHAATHALPLGTVGGQLVLGATLVPWADVLVHDTSGPATLTVSDGQDTRLAVELPAGLFSQDGVLVGVAEVNPADGGPYNAPADVAPFYFHAAFALHAWDDAGAVSFEPGMSVNVTLTDNGALPDPPVLVHFNPEQGIWNEIDGACARVDADRVTCALPHFSDFGLGGGAPPAGGGGGSGPDPDYNAAKNDYDAARMEAAQHYETAGDTTQSQATRDAAEAAGAEATDRAAQAARAMADAAKQYAATHTGDDTAMRQLIEAAAALQQTGQEADPALYEAIAAGVEARGRLVLDLVAQGGDDCRYLSLLEAMLSQFAMGANMVPELADSPTRQALAQAYNDLTLKCGGEWRGRVEYRFHLPGEWENWPAQGGITMDKLASNAGNHLTEVHTVHLTVDPLEGTLYGTDSVSIDFRETTYRQDFVDGEPDCGDDFGEVKLAFPGGLGHGSAYFEFDGSYVDPVFQLGPMQLISGAPKAPVAIHRQSRTRFYYRDQNDNCREVAQDTDLQTAPEYLGMLHQAGVAPPPITPPPPLKLRTLAKSGFGHGVEPDLTLEMMLNGNRVVNGDQVTISGSSQLTFFFPPLVYPFSRATVQWEFQNTGAVGM